MSELLDAMNTYFAKIKSPSYFMLDGKFLFPKNEAAVKRVLAGEYVFPRQTIPDFSMFEKEFGFPLPDVMKEFFTYYHPEIQGQHPQCPYPDRIDGFRTHESLSDDDLRVLMDRMKLCIRHFSGFAEEIRFVPVGYVDGYVDVMNDFIWMERSTGRIFVEWNEKPDGTPFLDSNGHRTEGNVYPTPLAGSLAEFICALNPYDE